MYLCRRSRVIVILFTIFLTYLAVVLLRQDNIPNSTKEYGENYKPEFGDKPRVLDDAAKNNIVEVQHGDKALNKPMAQDRPLNKKETTIPDTKQVMEKRKAALRDVCAQLPDTTHKYGPYTKSHLDHIVVDDKTQILYCFIPKIACTNFKRVFLGLAGVVNMSDITQLSGYEVHDVYSSRLQLLEDYPKDLQMKKLATYKKFMFVREPSERLLSAYKNKYFHPNPLNRQTFVRQILHYYEKYPVKKSLRINFYKKVKKDPMSVSFSEFLTYIVDNSETNSELNEHFVPYWSLCHPCDIQYDYIGKYETLTADTKHLFNQLHIDARFPERSDNYSAVTTDLLVREYYKDVPTATLKQLWNFLKTDYQLFDYAVPEEMKFNLK